MEDSDRALPAVNHHDGKAIGGLNGEQEARRVGEESVAGGWFIGKLGDRVNDVGVDLAERRQRPGMAAASAQLGEELGAIALDRSLGVCLRKAEVQGPAAIDARVAAWSGREPMNEPGEFLKTKGLEDRQFGLRGDPGCHGNHLS